MVNQNSFIGQLIKFCGILWHHYSEIGMKVLAKFALNSTVNILHGKPPFSVVYRFEPVLPLNCKIGMHSICCG